MRVAILLILSLLLTVVFSQDPPKKKKSDKKKPSCKRTKFDRKTTNYQAWREQMTVCDLLQDYDSAVRPSGKTPMNDQKGPVVVTVSLNIRSISAVSEKNMEFVAQFQLRQEWYDDRLRYMDYNNGILSAASRNFEFITVARDQRLWIPDTFFQNEKNGHYHMLDQENKFIKIRSDGLIVYDRRLTLHLSCPMILLTYPMDVQRCFIDFASCHVMIRAVEEIVSSIHIFTPFYAYTTNDIKYEWRNIDPIVLDSKANGALPNFDITKISNSTCHSITATGEYACLRVELRLTRVFSFFLLQLYIPSSMLVGVAWVSYWIDWKSTAARVPLAIVTLLTMITTSHAINSNLPPVSYAKSIDIWVGACVVFIFFSLIEYAVVNYLGIMDEHREMRKAACNRSRLSNVIDSDIYMQRAGQAMTSPASLANFSPVEKKRLLRRKRKKSFELREEEEGGMGMQLMNVFANNNGSSPPLGVQSEWTFENTTDLMYVGQRKRVELVRWCSVLSSRGRAERIDIIARIIFPCIWTKKQKGKLEYSKTHEELNRTHVSRLYRYGFTMCLISFVRTLNYNSAYYCVILANVYNKQRNNIICTAQFASWSIFTPSDDEFVEECMSVFLKWIDVSPSLRPSYPFFPFPTRNTSILDRILPSHPNRGTNELINGGIPSIVCEDEIDSSIDQESEGYGSDSSIDYDGDSEDFEGDDMSSSFEDEENTEEGYCSDDTSLDTYSIFGGGSRISSPIDQEEEIDCDSVPSHHTVIIPGPFADRLAALLPPIGTPFLINGCLVSSTVSNDASITLSSLFLRDRSFSHHSILSFSSSSSIDSHICGSECFYYDRLTTEDEREPLLSESSISSSSTVSSIEETEASKAMKIRMMKEVDEMIERIEKMKKRLEMMKNE
ncbi:glc-4 [Pristionchus pacificus]|uniref:Glc-4 n=1 Tax=Pristionchus pacificus TaxID=54126 RepID=A0A2A6CZP8_PRIPA|nr:glc-4 [Pristionchus pacificus]|eukprot:PDM83503.1 glc-4 [Pristionchus pacificus]